jgi:PAS domain S-box-containing protein
MVDKDQIKPSIKQDDLALQTRQAQEALLKSELQYRTTLNSMGDAIFVVDTEFKITLINDVLKQWNKTFGLETDIVGKSIFEVFPFLTEDIRNEYLEVIRTGRVIISEETFIINGREVTSETRRIPITEAGKVTQVVTALHDITEQKRTEKVQQVLFSISQATSTSRNLEELLFLIRQQLSTLIDTTNFYVALYDPQNDLYYFPYFVDQVDQDEFAPQKLRKSLTDYVRRTGISLLADRKVEQQLIEKGEVIPIGSPAEVWLGAPLKTKQGVIGVVAVQSYTDSTLYTEKDLELLTFISENIAMVIERKRAEDELQESERRFRDMLEMVNTLALLLDKDGNLTFCNDYLLNLTGYSKEEVLGKSWFDIFLPEEVRQVVRNVFQNIISNGSIPSYYENDIITKSGERRLIFWNNTVLHNPQGETIGAASIGIDITERNRAEEALKQSEEKYRNLVETAPDVIYSISAEDGALISLNSAFEKITGWQRSEWLGKQFSGLIHPEDLPLARETSQQAFRGESPPPYELRVLSKSGEYLTGEFTSMPLMEKGKIIGEFGIVRDITKRKRTEESLLASEKRYRDLVELSPNGIVIHQEGKVVFANRSALKLAGCKKPEELLGKSIFEFVHPDFRQKVVERVKTILSKKTSAPLMEEKFVKGDGTTYDVEVVAIATSYNAKPAVQVEFRDISERKRAEEERAIHQRELEVLYSFNEALTSTLDIKTILKQSLQLTLKATGLASAGIYMLDKEGYLQMVTCQGFSNELQSFARRLEKGTLYTWRAIEQNAMQEVSIDEYPESDFKKMLLKEGLKLLICIPLTSKDKPLGVMNLISKKVKVLAPWERDLLQSFGHQISIASENALYFESLNEHSQALERILNERSQFFSMASHELRTPITVINGYLDIINRNFENMSKIQIREIFKKLGDHSERLCLLVETLLSVSKLESPSFAVSRKPCEIGPIVEKTIYLCEHQAKSKNIVIRTKKFVVSGKRLRVLGDPIAIENVLINILENAIKYSYDKGEISINWVIKGNTLQLNCTDKGVGLPPGEQERIFDEFYRVERGGELKKSGTGLGLSIAKRLVERMGGKIWARSKGLGKGITISFTLTLAGPRKSLKVKK